MHTFLIAAALASLAPSPLAQEANPPFAHALQVQEYLLLPLPVEQILQGVTGTVIDPEGRWVVAGRQRLPDATLAGLDTAGETESSLHLWNARTRRTTLLWKQPGKRLIQPLFLLGENVLVQIEGADTAPQLLLVNPQRATVRTILFPTTVVHEPLKTLSARPGGDTALVQLWTEGDFHTILLSPEGNLRFLNLDKNEYVQGFTPDKQALYLAQLDPQTHTRQYFIFNLTTGTRTPLKDRPKIARPTPTLPQSSLHFVTQPTRLSEKEKPVQVLWLEDETKKRVLVGTELEPLAVLPTAALYTQNASLFALPLFAADPKAVEEKEKQLLARAITATARQIDSALEQYALDNKMLPPPGSDLISLLCGPDRYIRSSDAFYDAKGKPLLQWVWDGQTGSDSQPLKGANLATLAWKYGTITIRSGEDFAFK